MESADSSGLRGVACYIAHSSVGAESVVGDSELGDLSVVAVMVHVTYVSGESVGLGVAGCESGDST